MQAPEFGLDQGDDSSNRPVLSIFQQFGSLIWSRTKPGLMQHSLESRSNNPQDDKGKVSCENSLNLHRYNLAFSGSSPSVACAPARSDDRGEKYGRRQRSIKPQTLVEARKLRCCSQIPSGRTAVAKKADYLNNPIAACQIKFINPLCK